MKISVIELLTVEMKTVKIETNTVQSSSFLPLNNFETGLIFIKLIYIFPLPKPIKYTGL
jgi:hypothetical protein